MDYVRKKRSVTYRSAACKMYLRSDFCHRCAYCGSSEEVLCPNPIVADSFFEKDHYVPQKTGIPEVHEYSNLFYACRKCNGLKNEIALSLNPCNDDIFFGENPQIIGGGAEHNFFVTSTTAEGKRYIEDLELNSRYHLAMREQTCAHKKRQAEIARLIEFLGASGKLQDYDMLSIVGESDRYSMACGGSKHAIDVADACRYLNACGYYPNIVFEEYELDIKVTIHGEVHFGKVIPSLSEKYCRMDTTLLQEWRNSHRPCGVFRYYKSPQKVLFYPVDFNKIDWSKATTDLKSFISLEQVSQ